MTCHCRRGCAACRGGPCSCGVILPAQPVAARDYQGFRPCRECGSLKTVGLPCMHCAAGAGQRCGCAACESADATAAAERGHDVAERGLFRQLSANVQTGERCMLCHRNPCTCGMRCTVCGRDAEDESEPGYCARCGARMIRSARPAPDGHVGTVPTAEPVRALDWPGSTPEAVKALLAALKARYADAD